MSGRLEAAAEVLKLRRLLGVGESELEFLEQVPAAELRLLRESATESLFSSGAQSFERVAMGAKLIPSAVVATIAHKAFGPLLCARAAAAVDPAKAIDVASRLPAGFLADTTIELDPRRVADIISRVPEKLVVPVAAELGRRREYVTMGRFLAFVPDHAIVAAMTALSDEAMLRTAFVLEHKDRLDHALSLLPPERLPGVLQSASDLGLWVEALDLLQHLSDERRRDLASTPAFHDPEVLRGIVQAAARTGLWLELLPLVSDLPAEAIALLPPIVADLETEQLLGMISEAASSADVLVGLVGLLDLLDETTTERIVEVIDTADRTLGQALVDALTDPEHVRLLLERLPAPILAAVERAADRVGLRAEYDAAVASAR